jgi:hypothetical protein
MMNLIVHVVKGTLVLMIKIHVNYAQLDHIVLVMVLNVPAVMAPHHPKDRQQRPIVPVNHLTLVQMALILVNYVKLAHIVLAALRSSHVVLDHHH